MSQLRFQYGELFAALGRFIAKKNMSNLCVMEFEGGVIITGSVMYETSDFLNRRIETIVLSHDDLKRLIKER